MSLALSRRRVLVTRAAHQAEAMSRLLRDAGAVPIELPVIRLVDAADGGAALRSALGRIDEYSWLVCTSANTVERLARWGLQVPVPVKVAAIGAGTAEAIRALGIGVDLVPSEFVAESLLRAMPSGPGRVLLPRAAVAREVLPEGLRAKGWQVDVVEAYRTAPVDGHDGVPDAEVITFTSASAVDAFVDAFGVEAAPSVVACIGPVATAAARRRGLEVAVEPAEHTVLGLLGALVEHFARSR